MEKIQHNINSLSLIFAAFFIIEVAGLVFSYSMQPDTPIAGSLIDFILLVGFYSIIPLAIISLQLAAKYRSIRFLWLGIGIFVSHILFFISYGLITS